MVIFFRIFLLVILFSLNITSFTQEKRFITVAADGSGDYTTITAAVQSLAMFNYQRTEILVKNGIYNEKIRIDQDYITLKGESREKTILKYSQLRDDWIAQKDSIGPGIININGDDFILENITVENTQALTGSHAFTIYGTGTRTVILNSNIISKGGDTVALWDYKTGMYYHAGCYFEGSVDMVCPRGWCFIRDSKFYELRETAAVWHAGGDNINQKLVIRNSSFDGVKGFHLGRHHYEAQFYLLDCTFSENMADRPIYRVVYEDSNMNRPFNWGERYYYFDCKKEGEEFSWIRDNLYAGKASLLPEDITPRWTFDDKWDPESTDGPKIISYRIDDKSVIFTFNEKITVSGNPTLETVSGEILYYNSGGGSDTIRFTTSSRLTRLTKVKLTEGQLTGSTAGVHKRAADFSQLP
jgi:pectinesterase